MIVHLYPMSQKDFEEIRSLASVFPDTTLPYSVSPAIYTNFGSIVTAYVFLQILMIEGMRYEYNLFAQVNPKFPNWKYGILPWGLIGKIFWLLIYWLSARIKRGFSWLFSWLTQPKFMQAYGDAFQNLLPYLRRLGSFLYALLTKLLVLLGRILTPLGNFLASFWTKSEGQNRENKTQVKSTKNYKIEILDDEPPKKP